MVRGVLGSRVVYIEHRWRLSFVFFVLSLAIVGIPAFCLSRGEHLDSFAMVVIYAGCALVAAMALWERRLVTVDSEQGTVVVSQRRLILGAHRHEMPIRGLRVLTSSAEQEGAFTEGERRFYIWLQPAGQGRILFLGDLGSLDQVHDLVVQLSQDLRGATDD
jgi:hypothetical protein